MVSQPEHERLAVLDRLKQLAEEQRSLLDRLTILEADPAAKATPIPISQQREEALMELRGTVVYEGDIVSPAVDPDDWEANR